MDNATQINACAFFVKDDEGQIRESGIVPIIDVPKTKTIAIRPNPAKS